MRTVPAALTLFVVAGCGGGSTPASSDAVDQGPVPHCTADSDCDDGAECTEDRCVASPSGPSCQWIADDKKCGKGAICLTKVAGAPGCFTWEKAVCAGRPDGFACTPEDKCATGPGSCQKGVCEFTVKACEPGPCQGGGKCDPTTGDCSFTMLTDGEACDDGNACTKDDGCKAGACAGVAKVCDDKNPCTTDTCDPSKGCVFTNWDGVCDDGDACTGNDSCLDGKCSGKEKECDDKDPCTADACAKDKGCSHEPVTPCCGNSVTEELEECDQGPAGTDGCSPECKVMAMTLSSDSEPGLTPAVAWSDEAGVALAVHEAIAQDGKRRIVARPIGGDAALGLPVVTQDLTGVTRAFPALTAIPGTEAYLLAYYRPTSVDLRVLGKSGASTFANEGAFPLGGGKPGARIAVAVVKDRAAVAWQAIQGEGNQERWEAWLAAVEVGTDKLSTSPPQVLAGSADKGERAFVGGACSGGESGLVTISRVLVKENKQTLDIVPIAKDGSIGAMKQLAISIRWLPLPAACAPAGDGGFIVVSGTVSSLSEDLNSATLAMKAWFLTSDGEPAGEPLIVYTAEIVKGKPLDACIPYFSAVAANGKANWVVFCSFFEGTGLTITGLEKVLLKAIVLDDQGFPIGAPKPVAGAGDTGFVAGLSAIAGPYDSTIVVWHESPVIIPDDESLSGTEGLVKAVFTGKF